MAGRIDDFVRRVKNPFLKMTSRANETFEVFKVQDVCPREVWENIPHLRLEKGPVELLEGGAGSRLGGPAPIVVEGHAFVGQLDLEELARVHGSKVPLPATGTLTLFASLVQYPDKARVQLRTDIVPTAGPPTPGRRLTAHLVERVDEVAERDREMDGSAPGRMFWGQSPQSGTWLDEAAALELDAKGITNSLKGLREAEARGIDVVAILRGLTRWRMLWQIDCDEDIALMAVGEARLRLFIRLEDLEAGRFDRIVPITTLYS